MPVQWQKDQKIDSPGHILVKALKAQNKERIAKAAMKKGQVTYKGRPLRSISGCSTEPF